ncbi:MAG: SDR family NAD(P)-dependent oxidoreductase [Acidimicrobiia bacterium]
MDSQTVLIAGATGNVGGGAAVALARRGAHVVLLGRDPERLKARAKSIRAALSGEAEEPTIDTLAFDLSDMESVRLAAADALERFPKIDGLILSVVTLAQDGPNILPSGHELMFATNVMGPFLFTQLLVERMQESDGLVLDVVAPFYKEIDWEDLESIEDHKAGDAYNRTKTMNRVIAGELARRYEGKISSVAFNPWFIIDKADPELHKRWPKGFTGLWWKVLTLCLARPPRVAGEPIADLMLACPDRQSINGALFKLEKRAKKPDRAMQDEELGQRLWDELVLLTAN